MIYMFLSNNPSSGDINSSNLSCSIYFPYCANFKETKNIGITHVFSCINICRLPRKLFENEAVRPSVQASPEGPGKCFNAMKQTCVIVILA